jgi:fructoselysine-6-P-deglycase FrlB-like protein
MRFADGVQAQPAVLARSAQVVRSALGEIAPLPRDAVVGLVGIGASEHIARGAASAWRRAGLRAVAISASELLSDGASVADVYVGLSESGRSAETVAAMASLTGRRVGITNGPGSPLTEVVDEVVLLDSGPDSPVYTTGYTATLQAVAMLGEHWGAGAPSDWSALPGQVAAVLEQAETAAEALAKPFGSARIIDVIASGAAVATAGEGALLLREAARAHTSAQETYNYLHGPMEPLEADTACIIVGDGRELQLARDVAALGCQTMLVTADPASASTEECGSGLRVVPVPATTSPLARAVLEILPVQALAWRIASDRGLAVDGFRYEQSDTKLPDR